MPHALLLVFGEGNQDEAWLAFDEAVPAEVPRTALVDTFWDEPVESLLAADTLEDRLDSVRIDTTGSRRGDFRHIIREVRWELDAAGYDDVDIFCSGGLTPETISDVRDVADGFGVGSYITGADSVDFSLDLVEIDGEPISKRGKLSGDKQVYRTADGGHEIRLVEHEPPEDGTPLLEPLVRDGEIVRQPDLERATERCLADADAVGFEPPA